MGFVDLNQSKMVCCGFNSNRRRDRPDGTKMISFILSIPAVLASATSPACDMKVFNADPEACRKMTLECAQQLNLSKVIPECLYNIVPVVLDRLEQKSITELTSHPQLSTSGDVALTRIIFRKNDWESNPAKDFLYRAVKTPTEAQNTVNVLKGSNAKLIAHLFVPETRNLTWSLCRELTFVSMSCVGLPYMKQIHPECFKALRPEAIKGITPEQLAVLPVQIFANLTLDQARRFRILSLQAMTKEQASNFGPDVQINPGSSSVAYANHPCSLVPDIISQLANKQVTDALRSHCPLVI